MGARDLIAKALAGIKAFHSSPHDFDKFDLSKIGTGEGAQVYGHGLYFAENPAVSGQGGQYWQQFQKRFNWPEQTAADQLKHAGFDHAKAAEEYRKITEQLIARGDVAPQTLEARAGVQRLLESGKPVGPRTYEVNINADPARMLDWDKPLKDQPYLHDFARHVEPSQKPGARSRVMLDKWREGAEQADYPLTGDAFHRAISWDDPVRASSQMREAGIPGIKYLDEGSRIHNPDALRILEAQGGDRAAALTMAQARLKSAGMGDLQYWDNMVKQFQPPTSNYVVFDPSIVDITKKYAVPGAVGGTAAMGALANQDSYEVQ